MSEEYLEIDGVPRNSIEIGETSKSELYMKSLKLRWGSNDKWQDVIEELFLIRDEVARRINNG